MSLSDKQVRLLCESREQVLKQRVEIATLEMSILKRRADIKTLERGIEIRVARLAIVSEAMGVTLKRVAQLEAKADARQAVFLAIDGLQTGG